MWPKYHLMNEKAVNFVLLLWSKWIETTFLFLIQATRVPTDQKIVIATTSKWIYLVEAFLSVVVLFVILILGFSICTKISVKKMIANRR